MTGKDGVYIGNGACANRLEVVEIFEITCCGGRIGKRSRIRCSKKGIIEADKECGPKCDLIELKKRG